MKPTPIRTALALALGITETQIRNLAILARFHHTHQPRVRMENYRADGSKPCDNIVPCGTAGCLVGWAPAAGIRGDAYDQNWTIFVESKLGCRHFSPSWRFMFSANRPDGAKLGARRIAWFLEGRDIAFGTAPEPPESWSPNWSLIDTLAQ